MTYLRFAVAWMFLCPVAAVAAGTPGPARGSDIVTEGYRQFIDSCAFCHGIDGKGQGDAANLLSRQPADLTRLSRDNDGVFPLRSVYYTIDGREALESHGSGEMPVWGALWDKGVPPEYAEAYVQSRILQLLLYLNSIQE